MVSLIPGGIYSVIGKEWSTPECYEVAMYVRTEKIDNREWHVFAALENEGILSRVRMPTSCARIARSTVYSLKDFVTSVIVFSRKEREEEGKRLVNSFLDEAYALAKQSQEPRLSALAQKLTSMD